MSVTQEYAVSDLFLRYQYLINSTITDCSALYKQETTSDQFRKQYNRYAGNMNFIAVISYVVVKLVELNDLPSGSGE